MVQALSVHQRSVNTGFLLITGHLPITEPRDRVLLWAGHQLRQHDRHLLFLAPQQPKGQESIRKLRRPDASSWVSEFHRIRKQNSYDAV